MANYCYNEITLTGDTASLLKLESLFSDAEDESLTEYLYESADELGVNHPTEPSQDPVDLSVSLYDSGESSSSLTITFDTKWWFDEHYVDLAALVFAEFDMTFYAEEFGAVGCFRATWTNGNLKSFEDDESYVTFEDPNGKHGWAIQWRVSGWEIDEKPKTPEEVFTLLVENEDEEVRFFAAKHPDIPSHLLNRLLTDESEFVAAAARSNPVLT